MRIGAGFGKDVRAVSAIEFALVAPVLLFLMLGGLELVNYIRNVRRLELYASSVSEMISQAVPPNSQTSSATVNQLDVHFGIDSGMVIFPYLLEDAAIKGIPWYQNVTINFASIKFTQISTACNGQADLSPCYLAKVVWTSSGASGGSYRPCILPQLPTTSNATNRYMLPATIFGPGSIIAIDVSFNYTPRFGSGIFPTLGISRSVYVQPRYADLINFDPTNNDGIVSICP